MKKKLQTLSSAAYTEWKSKSVVASMCLIIAGLVMSLVPIETGNLLDSGIIEKIGFSLLLTGFVGLLISYLVKTLLVVNEEQGDAANEETNTTSGERSAFEELIKMREALELNSRIHPFGIRDVHLDRNKIDFIRHLRAAKPGTEIRLLGVCLRGFIDASSQELMVKKVSDDRCRIKMLTLSPTSSFIQSRAEAEGRHHEEIRRDILSANDMHQNLLTFRIPKDARERFKYGHYDAPPHLFIFSTESVMIVGLYLRGEQGEFFPHFELEAKVDGLYASFLDYFNSLWKSQVRLYGLNKEEVGSSSINSLILDTEDNLIVPVEIYLQDETELLDREVLMSAVDSLMEVLGFELENEEDPVWGSWFKRFWYNKKDERSSSDAMDAFRGGKEAVVANIKNIPPLSGGIEEEEAAARLVESTRPFNNIVLRLGNIIFVKVTKNELPQAIAVEISPKLARMLDENPAIIKNPEAMWEYLVFNEGEEPTVLRKHMERDPRDDK